MNSIKKSFPLQGLLLSMMLCPLAVSADAFSDSSGESLVQYSFSRTPTKNSPYRFGSTSPDPSYLLVKEQRTAALDPRELADYHFESKHQYSTTRDHTSSAYRANRKASLRGSRGVLLQEYESSDALYASLGSASRRLKAKIDSFLSKISLLEATEAEASEHQVLKNQQLSIEERLERIKRIQGQKDNSCVQLLCPDSKRRVFSRRLLKTATTASYEVF